MNSEENTTDDTPPLNGTQGEGGESSTTCMICMEEWTIGSDHRLCCLKCGHLFGRSCIERWIKEKGTQAKCPNCNKAAKKSDLRDLWCKTVKATDTTEVCKLQQLLENERKLRKADAAIAFHTNLRLDMLQKDVDKLKRGIIERDEKIAKLQSVLDRYYRLRAQRLAGNCNDTTEIIDIDRDELELPDHIIDDHIEPKEMKGMFHFADKVEFSSTGGCRSIALCPTSALILVAQPAPRGTHSMFGHFGLRKFSILESSHRDSFIPLHAKIITSIQLRPIGDLILTSSQDKKIRLTSITNNICIQTYQCPFEPTCVAWSAHRDQQFYVGSGNCFVYLYDTRNTSEHIYQTSQRIANTRLLSIAATNGPDTLNGLLVNDSRGCQYLAVSDESEYTAEQIDRSIEHMTSHQLPFDGLMGTVDYDKQSRLALVTTRHSPVSHKNCTHNLIRLKRTEQDEGGDRVECEHVRTFMGGRSAEDLRLSQSRILRHPNLCDSVLVGACDDEARGIKLWDASDNTEYQTIKTDTFIRDMILYTPDNSNNHMLYALSERGLSTYKWDYA